MKMYLMFEALTFSNVLSVARESNTHNMYFCLGNTSS